MTIGQILEFKRSLKLETPQNLAKVFEELFAALGEDDFPTDFLDQVLTLYRGGFRLQRRQLSKIIADTKSTELFQEAERRGDLTDESIYEIFAWGFVFGDIEKKVIKILCENYMEDGNFFRKRIVDAMGENGGLKSLEVLNFIKPRLRNRLAELENSPPSMDSNSPMSGVIDDLKHGAVKVLIQSTDEAIGKIMWRINHST